MAINTVQKAVEELERMGLLTVRRRVGASNFYQPSRYITIGTVHGMIRSRVKGVTDDAPA